jgi:ribosomal protein S19E (S16A)
MTRLDEFLTAAEFDALKQVDEGGGRPIPRAVSGRLVELGYVQKTANGFAITSAGQMRLALGL